MTQGLVFEAQSWAFSPSDPLCECLGVNTPISLLRKLALPSGPLVRETWEIISLNRELGSGNGKRVWFLDLS